MNFDPAFIAQKAKMIRRLTIDSIGKLGVGHVGGCLSIADLLAVLYYGGYMRVDPKNPKMEGRDRLVISKGHAGPALYATLADRGFFPVEELDTLNRPNTHLPSHCDMLRTPGVDMTAGSLGQGFSCAVGIAIGSKIRGDGARIYVIIGDGESQEGQIWEAAMLAGHKKLDNLIAFTDYNHMPVLSLLPIYIICRMVRRARSPWTHCFVLIVKRMGSAWKPLRKWWASPMWIQWPMRSIP